MCNFRTCDAFENVVIPANTPDSAMFRPCFQATSDTPDGEAAVMIMDEGPLALERLE